uniref:B30.2/SPRY domain-containing protein n=1 Tax=Cyprinus carpio TaxID=7962 RepID=A0A8C1QRU4_CYPCA
MKGNVMFSEEDLIESGIDLTDASVYSGICTEIFKEESVIHQRKVYSFIHLSVQEFLAGFYMFYLHVAKIKEPLHVFLNERPRGKHSKKYTLCELLRTAVDKALNSKNGHLDLFLRFLLGISLESNQRLLKDLLTHTENSSESISRTITYIKAIIKDMRTSPYNLSTERSINLFLCLLEVKDQTLSREIQEFVKSNKHPKTDVSAAHCSAISYMLQMSEEPLEELDLKKYNTSDEGRRRLIPAVNNCRKAVLAVCKITAQDCEIVSSALQSSDSVLRELDLSNSYLQDLGLKLLSDALKSPNCQLQILRLVLCNLTAQCCQSLSPALKSSNSILKELDLSNNDLQDSGVCILSDALKSPHCKVKKLRLAMCNLTSQSCGTVQSALQSSDSVLTELDLSNNDLQDSGVKRLSDALRSSNCQLEKLRLSGCMVTEEGCGYLSSALSSNPTHLRELDLSYNHPGDSGVQLLNNKLQDPNCKLKILNVEYCGEMRIRAGLQKYAYNFTLDPNTANTHLILSEGKRQATHVDKKQPYPDHPDRFEHYPQVLCEESLTGRCYWEVEWSGGEADISVTYKGISRKGRSNECVFGYNENSWRLECTHDKCTSWHNFKSTILSVPSARSSRLGVYVDVSAGTLSFYRVSDTHTLTHLHTFNTTFTEPLYVGFSLSKCSVSLGHFK